MRRYLTSELIPKIFLSGVTASVRHRKISVSIPVVRVANSSGFGPTRLRYRSQSKSASGMSELMKRTSLGKVMGGSEVFDEIHSLIQMSDLFTVAVEEQRVAAAVFADAAFRRLAPTRMRHVRVHV